MRKFSIKLISTVCLALALGTAFAQERTGSAPAEGGYQTTLFGRATASAQEVLASSSDRISSMIDKGLGFLGIRYRMGGNGPESGGFDCSGLVKKVFGDALGVNLPRTAVEMAQMGERVGSQDLKPGDLVFFNTMRRTFSHVGIYLGDRKFLHAPSTGGVVRVDSIDNNYWITRFTGGRRLVPEAEAAQLPVEQTVRAFAR